MIFLALFRAPAQSPAHFRSLVRVLALSLTGSPIDPFFSTTQASAQADSSEHSGRFLQGAVWFGHAAVDITERLGAKVAEAESPTSASLPFFPPGPGATPCFQVRSVAFGDALVHMRELGRHASGVGRTSSRGPGGPSSTSSIPPPPPFPPPRSRSREKGPKSKCMDTKIERESASTSRSAPKNYRKLLFPPTNPQTPLHCCSA